MRKDVFLLIAFLSLAGIVLLGCNTEGTGQEEEKKEDKQYTVTFDADNGTFPPVLIMVNEGESIDSPLPIPSGPPEEAVNPARGLVGIEVNDNRIFKGWFTEKNGNGTEFKATSPVTRDIIVYACWETMINEVLMGNFTGEVFDRSNYRIMNVYDDGSKSPTANYTATISGDSSNNILNAGRAVTVNFTSTENSSFKTSLATTVSKTLANTGLPVVYINTENAAAINSKSTYLKAKIQIVSENPAHCLNVTNDYIHEIRGRGNSTWLYPKKPYRFRLRTSTSLFGLPAARNWVLLANWKDWSLLSGTIGFELGHRLDGMAYVNTAVHVDVVLNGNYSGNYVLTEHLQVGTGRVDINPNTGYLVEFDISPDTDYNFITTTTYLPAWVKNPDLGGAYVPGYQFVVDSVNEFDRLLNGSGFPSNGYMNILNMDSFVDYLLHAEIVRNREINHPKSVYMHRDGGANDKINMGPIWDFDWAFGLDNNKTIDMSTAADRYTNDDSAPNKFGRFYDDPAFNAMYKARWNEKYNDIRSLPNFVDTMYDQLRVSASLDAMRWFSSSNINYANETGKMKQWLTTRIDYLNTEINR